MAEKNNTTGKKNKVCIKKDTAIQFLKQFPAPLGKLVSELIHYGDPREQLQKVKKFHQLVLLYSTTIMSSVYSRSYDCKKILEANSNDPQSLAITLKQKPLADKICSNVIAPFHDVRWKLLAEWAKKMEVQPDEKNSKIKKVAWSKDNLHDYLKDMGNELGFLRNFRVFKYDKSRKKLISQSERFPDFPLDSVYKDGEKILDVPEDFFEDSFLVVYNIVENIFIPIIPFVISKESTLFILNKIIGQKAVYQKIHDKLEMSDEKLYDESEILPKDISFFQILIKNYKKDCKECFPELSWRNEFLLSLVAGVQYPGVPNLLLRKGDVLEFTSVKNNQVKEEKFVVQEIEGLGMGRGVFTEVWRVKGKLPGGGLTDYAIKILKPIFANTRICKEFDREIKNMQLLAKEFDKSDAAKYKKYFFIEVLKRGRVSFHKWWNSPCFLMEAADCSLRNRIDYFEDKKKDKKTTISLINSLIQKTDTESRKELYSRLVWPFYCMRHLVAICEKLHLWGDNLCHCNIKPENILYFSYFQKQPDKETYISQRADKEVGNLRTPLLADFGLAEHNEVERNSKGKNSERKSEVFKHSVYAAPELKTLNVPKPRIRTDQYSLGIIFFELIFGDVPRGKSKNGNVSADKEKIIGNFKQLDMVLGTEQFQPFIEKILLENPSVRYDITLQKSRYSEFRRAFFDLEKEVMQKLIDFFKEELLPTAQKLLKKGKNAEALKKIDLLSHESVRYSCLYKEQKEEEEIAREGQEYTASSCRFFQDEEKRIDNPLKVIEEKIPDAKNTNIGGYRDVSSEDISEVLKQLGGVLGKCYGFLSHCYPHDTYLQRLARLLTSYEMRETQNPAPDVSQIEKVARHKEKRTGQKTGKSDSNMGTIDKILFIIFQQTFKKESKT